MKKRKAAAAAAVTVAAAAGVITGTAFDSPMDLVPEIAVTAEQQAEDEGAAVMEQRRGPAARVRQWVLGLPAAVRMLVAVPLWCFGWVLMSAASLLWAGATPWLARLLSWGCLAVLLLAVFTCSVKAAFPGVPLRKILRPGNVLFLLLASAVLCAADLALPTMWKGYNAISRTVWRVGAAALLAFLCCAELKHQAKRTVRKQQVAPVSKRTAVELEAMRLADTVCGTRNP